MKTSIENFDASRAQPPVLTITLEVTSTVFDQKYKR